MTMRDLFREFVAIRERDLDAYDQRVTLAWQMAAFTRASKLPKLDTLKARRAASRPPAMTEQRANLERFAHAFGLPVRQTRLVLVNTHA